MLFFMILVTANFIIHRKTAVKYSHHQNPCAIHSRKEDISLIRLGNDMNLELKLINISNSNDKPKICVKCYNNCLESIMRFKIIFFRLYMGKLKIDSQRESENDWIIVPCINDYFYLKRTRRNEIVILTYSNKLLYKTISSTTNFIVKNCTKQVGSIADIEMEMEKVQLIDLLFILCSMVDQVEFSMFLCSFQESVSLHFDCFLDLFEYPKKHKSVSFPHEFIYEKVCRVYNHISDYKTIISDLYLKYIPSISNPWNTGIPGVLKTIISNFNTWVGIKIELKLHNKNYTWEIKNLLKNLAKAVETNRIRPEDENAIYQNFYDAAFSIFSSSRIQLLGNQVPSIESIDFTVKRDNIRLFNIFVQREDITKTYYMSEENKLQSKKRDELAFIGIMLCILLILLLTVYLLYKKIRKKNKIVKM
ncbi:hypothetical protein NUSPORA_01424 [Nucleospora cyclopteri]